MSTETKTYNGWTNYETWAVNLWMGNDQGSYSYYGERSQEAYDDAEADDYFTRDERATLDLSDILKRDFEEANPLADQASVWSDMLSAALSEVNWYEIAEHLIADVDKEAEEVTEE